MATTQTNDIVVPNATPALSKLSQPCYFLSLALAATRIAPSSPNALASRAYKGIHKILLNINLYIITTRQVSHGTKRKSSFTEG
jgi:hypothetical protein